MQHQTSLIFSVPKISLKSIRQAAMIFAFGLFAIAANGQRSTLLDPIEEPALVEILPGWRQNSDGQVQHVFAFKIILVDGWKTYWRVPGEEGIAPKVFWSLLTNARTPEIHFPAPRLIIDQESETAVVGYQNQVVFPVVIDIPDPDAKAIVAGDFEFGVCDKVCIPERIQFRAELAADLNIWVDEITAAQGRKVKMADTPNLAMQFNCQIRPYGNGKMDFSSKIETNFRPPTDVLALPEYPDPNLWFSDMATTLLSDGTVQLHARINHSQNQSVYGVERGKLKVTVVTPEKAIQYSGCKRSGTS